MKRKKVLCAIPCYNESYNLPALFKDLKSNNITEIADIVFIDDCSKDHSVQMIKAQGFNLIQHEKNMGYGQAVKSGFQHAVDGEYHGFVIFPGDGQRSAADLAKLIQIHSEGQFDVVTGSKFHIYSELYGPIRRCIGNIIYWKIAQYGWGSPIQDVLSGFKIYSVAAVKPFFFSLPGGYPFDICFSLYAARFGLKLTEVDVKCRYDAHTSKMKSVLWVSFKMLYHLIYHYFAQPFICPVPREAFVGSADGVSPSLAVANSLPAQKTTSNKQRKAS